MEELRFLKNDSLWEAYGNWLLAEARFRKRGYGSLMKQLHLIEFVWHIDMDENRAEDGMKYRPIFLKSLMGNAPMDLCEELQNRPCSVLEMLLGLAIRIDFEYTGDVGNPRPDLLFWEFCENLELDKAKNRGFSCEFVNSQIAKWQNSHKNSHRKNGYVTPFPVKNGQKEALKTEIWHQIHQYLTENA